MRGAKKRRARQLRHQRAKQRKLSKRRGRRRHVKKVLRAERLVRRLADKPTTEGVTQRLVHRVLVAVGLRNKRVQRGGKRR